MNFLTNKNTTSLHTLGFTMIATLGMFCWSGCNRSGMTKEKAMRLIDSAGGINRVNSEASAIFAKYQAPELGGLSLLRPEITNYPAIAVLLSNSVPKSFLLVPGGQDGPPQIVILYGPHFHLKCIRIFKTTDGLPAKYKSPPSIELSSNIFLAPIEGEQ